MNRVLPFRRFAATFFLPLLLTCTPPPLAPHMGFSCGEHFIVGAFVDPPMTMDAGTNKALLTQLKDNGFNTLSGWTFGEEDAQSLPAIRRTFDAVKATERGNECSQYSLRVLVREWEHMPYTVRDTCESDGQIYARAVILSDTSAATVISRYGNGSIRGGLSDEDRLYMAGYFPVDEPDPLVRCGGAYDDVTMAGNYAARIKEADPEKWVLVNLWGNVGREGIQNGDEYRAYINRIFSLSGSDVISFDLYPFKFDQGWHNDMVSTYFYVHRMFAEECGRLGKRYFSFVYSSPDNYSFGDHVATTKASLRFMCHTPIAYGATGIFYFTYWGVIGERGLYDSLGNATVLQPWARDINARILNISDTLMALNWLGTIHGADRDPYSREGGLATRGEVIDSVYDSLAFAGEFSGSTADEYYLVVINKDWRADASTSRSIVFSLKSKYAIKAVDGLSRGFLDSAYTDSGGGGGTRVSLTVPAGEMCVLSVE